MFRVQNLPPIRVLVVLGAALVATFMVETGASAQDQDIVLPSAVRTALEQNGTSLTNIEVEWVQQRSSHYELDELLRILKLPANMKEFFEPRRSGMKIQDNLLYGRYTKFAPKVDKSERLKALVKIEREVAFDGTTLYSGSHKVANSNSHAFLSIWTLEKVRKTEGALRYFEVDYFYQAGYKIVESPQELTARPTSLVLDLIDKGAPLLEVTTTKLEGRSVYQLVLKKTDQTMIFYLDPEFGYAVVRREELMQNGTLAARAVLTDFARLESQSDIWLPRKCRVVYYAWPSIPESQPTEEPLLVDNYVVTLLRRRDIQPDEFRLDDEECYTEPGTHIADARLSGPDEERVSYQVPINPEDLDEVIATAMRGSPSHQSSTRIVLMLANLVFIVLLVLLLWYRRKFVTKR